MNPFVDTPGGIQTVGIVDADVIVHKISRAAEKQIRWPTGVWTWHADEEEAKLILDDYLHKIKESLGITEYIMCLSSDTNFRHSIYGDYKANRNDPTSYGPILKQFLREYLRANYETIEVDDLEADDILGILMTTPGYKAGANKILMTIDKDLDTIPGTHYNFDKETLYDVEPEQADYFFYEQTLTGDRVDNIPGCPSYGPKTAQKLLDSVEPEFYWETVVSAYVKKGLTEEDALMNARLVRILRSTEWDTKTKQLKLWSPPNGKENDNSS